MDKKERKRYRISHPTNMLTQTSRTISPNGEPDLERTEAATERDLPVTVIGDSAWFFWGVFFFAKKD
jgi:hypothetical protein